MCQLFGVSSPEKLEVNAYLKEFFSHSSKHPHGWGIAIFFGDAVNLEKEPLPAWQSGYLRNRLSDPILVSSMIAHIRQASRGGLAYANCHPFVGRDDYGRAWTLAHNGTLFAPPQLSHYSAEQRGSTDSERILLHLLHSIDLAEREKGRPLEAEERFTVADGLISELARDNKLNLLFYDGELMYVHSNKPGTLYCKYDGPARVFATVPLDGGDWSPLPLSQLLAFREGQLLFSGTAHGHDYLGPDGAPLDLEWSQL